MGVGPLRLQLRRRDAVPARPVVPDETPVVRAVLPRWLQLALAPIIVLAVWALVQLAGKVLLLFIVAGLIALLLNPAVALLQRDRLPRGLAVLLVYLFFFVVLAGIAVLLANPISNQVDAFTKNVPGLIHDANHRLADVQNYLNDHGFHVHLIKQGKTALQTFGDKVAKAGGSLVSFGGSLLTTVASTIFDIVIVFVLSVYMLLYGPAIGRGVRRLLPDGDGSARDDYPTILQRAVSSYVRGQLTFSIVMGVTAGVSLYVYGLIGLFPDGRTYAVAFGAFLAVMELVPYIGPILGALPPILVALFTNPIDAVWVALLFLALQQLEGHVVAPQIFSHSLRINPLLVILALLLGEQIDGIMGAIVALPSLAVLRETVLYLHRHVELEPWGRDRGPLL